MNVKAKLALAMGMMVLMAGCAADDTTRQVLTMEQTPLSVRRGIERAYPDAKVREIEKETYKETGAVHYRIDVLTRKGQEAKFELAEDGEVLKKH